MSSSDPVEIGGSGFGRSTSARAVYLDGVARAPRESLHAPSGDEQLRRILAGAGHAIASHGYGRLTVGHVIEAAGVSRATFYARFGDKRECVLAAHRDVFERLVATLLAAAALEHEWPLKARAALAAALRLLASEPGAIQLLTLNSAGSDPSVARRVGESNAGLANLLREGRRHLSCDPMLPDLTEEATVGALLALAAARVDEGGVTDLAGLESQLCQLLLMPYLGADRAADVAQATSRSPVPRSPARRISAAASSGPRKGTSSE